MMRKDFRQLLEEYLEQKQHGIRDSKAERELIQRHRYRFRKWVGEKRPAALFGYTGFTKTWEFWECVQEAADEAFLSFDTEDVIFPGSGQSLFERILAEGYSSPQIERMLYWKCSFKGRKGECAAVMFLQKRQADQWRESEIMSGARDESEPSKKLAREDEHPERQRANAYINLRRVLVKEFLLFLFSKKAKGYTVSDMNPSLPAFLLRRGLQAWKKQIFRIGYAENRQETDLMGKTLPELCTIKFYKQQIEWLLQEAGFPLREGHILTKIINETKPDIPQTTELNEMMADKTHSPEKNVCTEEMKRAVQEFWESLTDEEKQIQNLRYQHDEVTAFDTIGEALKPKRSSEHCRMSDKRVRQRMIDMLCHTYPHRHEMKQFVSYFWEQVNNYHLCN